MKTLLVTGGCGFIGSHFIRLALETNQWRVVNLDKLTYAGNLENLADVDHHGNYSFVKGDIADARVIDEALARQKPSAIINFAAESHVDRSILDASDFVETNYVGVRVLLEGARRHAVSRFVQISTDEVYGDIEGKESCAEDSPLAPSSPYSATKAAADLLLSAYWRTYGFPAIIVRSTNNYGPCQFPEKLIPLMIRNALGGAELPVYGDGLQRREWLYVEDNCRCILAVLERGELGRIYNVGVGEEKTNLEVVEKVCRLLAEEKGVDPICFLKKILFIKDRPGHDRRYSLRAERVRAELGWAPRAAFETGLRSTIRWYLDHEEWVQRVTTGEYQNYYNAVYARAWEECNL